MSPKPERRHEKGISNLPIVFTTRSPSTLSTLHSPPSSLLFLLLLLSLAPLQMRTIMARTPHESSFSFSKRHFQRIIGKGGGGEERKQADGGEAKEEFLAFSNSSSNVCDDEPMAAAPPPARKRGASSAAVAVSRFRSVIAAAIARRHRLAGLGPRVTGTLFGHRRGHVHFAFQVDPRSCPVLLIKLATPTSMLVREMASRLVRIALECERRGGKAAGKLLEEALPG